MISVSSFVVVEIWIVLPPAPPLLTRYAYALKEGGRLYVITDVEDLHQWHVSKVLHPISSLGHLFSLAICKFRQKEGATSATMI